MDWAYGLEFRVCDCKALDGKKATQKNCCLVVYEVALGPRQVRAKLPKRRITGIRKEEQDVETATLKCCIGS